MEMSTLPIFIYRAQYPSPFCGKNCNCSIDILQGLHFVTALSSTVPVQHTCTYLHMVEINTIHVKPLHTIKILILSSHRNLTPETLSHAYVTATFMACTNMTRAGIKTRDSLILHHYHQQLRAHRAQKNNEIDTTHTHVLKTNMKLHKNKKVSTS